MNIKARLPLKMFSTSTVAAAAATVLAFRNDAPARLTSPFFAPDLNL